MGNEYDLATWVSEMYTTRKTAWVGHSHQLSESVIVLHDAVCRGTDATACGDGGPAYWYTTCKTKSAVLLRLHLQDSSRIFMYQDLA